jgi:hypothetical protein
MAQTIQIKRSSSTAAPGSNLAAGELAYSSNSDKLFIGHPDGTTGNIVIASTSPLTVGGDIGTDVSINIQDLLDITGDTGITTSISKTGSTVTLSVDLDDTAITPGSYGSATEVPTFTVDQQGRLTAAGSESISTSFTLAGDSGTAVVSGGNTLTVSGTGIATTAAEGDTLTINLDLNDLTDTAFDVATDSLAFLDASDNTTKRDSFADIIGLVAGSGLTASAGTLALTSNSLTIGSTTIALGGTSTTLAGLEAVTVDNIQIGVSGTGEIDTSTGDLTLDSASGETVVDDNLTVTGNLTVQGTTTSVNSTTVELGDNILELNSLYSGDAPSANAGIEVNRGGGAVSNVALRWNETTDFWQVTVDGSTYSNLLTVANFEGQIPVLDGGTF